MWRTLGAEMLVQGPSDIEFRDGVFHVVERYSDDLFIRKVYTPAIFVAAIAVANQALAKWQREQLAAAENIAQFRRKPPV